MAKKHKPVSEIRNWTPPDEESVVFEPASIAWDLKLRALNGDDTAIRELLFAGGVFCQSLVDLAYSEHPSMRAALRRIASEKLTWPVEASRHGRVRGNTNEVNKYLSDIELGSGKNINQDAVDSRNHDRLAGAMFFFDAIQSRGKIDLRRDGLTVDGWLASETGKKTKKEIKAIFDEHFSHTWRSISPLKPLIDHAESEATRIANNKRISVVTDIAIMRELILTIAKQIHGMLAD